MIAETNVVVLNSTEGTAALTFNCLASFAEFAANFADNQNGWDKTSLLVLVHRNGQTLKWRFKTIDELVAFTQGFNVAGWLFTDEGSPPAMDYLEWLNGEGLTNVFDSRLNEDSEEGKIARLINES